MGGFLASEKCQQEKRKTVNGEDILFAMTSLGFENYGEALKIYLARYREVCLNRRIRLLRYLFFYAQLLILTLKNLVARGEHQRPPSGAGGEGTSGPEGYDNTQAVLGNPMDPSSQATDFASYSVAHQPDYS